MIHHLIDRVKELYTFNFILTNFKQSNVIISSVLTFKDTDFKLYFLEEREEYTVSISLKIPHNILKIIKNIVTPHKRLPVYVGYKCYLSHTPSIKFDKLTIA